MASPANVPKSGRRHLPIATLRRSPYAVDHPRSRRELLAARRAASRTFSVPAGPPTAGCFSGDSAQRRRRSRVVRARRPGADMHFIRPPPIQLHGYLPSQPERTMSVSRLSPISVPPRRAAMPSKLAAQSAGRHIGAPVCLRQPRVAWCPARARRCIAGKLAAGTGVAARQAPMVAEGTRYP